MIILGLIVLCVLALMAFLAVPYFIGAGLTKVVQLAGGSAIQQDMERRSSAVGFQADKSFLPDTGLAFDTSRQLFYVGRKQGGRVVGGIYPVSALLKYSSGHEFLGNHQKYYLDLVVDDLNAPKWRFWFGGSQQRLSDVSSTIDVVWERNSRSQVAAT